MVSSRLAAIVVECIEFVVARLNSEPLLQYNTAPVEFVHMLPVNIYPFNSMLSINVNKSTERRSTCLQSLDPSGKKTMYEEL